MSFENTATRLWKRLSAADRLIAAQHLFQEPTPEAVAGAVGAIVRSRKMRPQAVRAMTAAQQAQAVAHVLDPGEALAASLLVALHLGERRALLGAFLDAVKLPHEDGVLTEAADQAPPVTPETARAGVKALGTFPADQVATYLNTLYLQDPERWDALRAVGDGA